MTRRLTLLCATLVALAAQPAFGLGLGELELNSALNQRFDAEIELTNVRNLEPEEILPNLASQEDFARVGVERNYILTDLRFQVQRDEKGELFVKVNSTKPIVEPYLNFIIEVLWPSGRILREYTVLLDPPVFGEKGIEPIKSTETGRPSQELAQQPTPPPAAPEPVPSQQTEPPRQTRQQPTEQRLPDEGEMVDGEYGMTGPGDTLWTIASKVRPANDLSIQQTMLAIQRANPEAFINNNINLLKAGHVLRIPDAREMRRLSRDEAIAEVQVHNDEFDRFRSGDRVAQLDATGRQQSSTPSGQQASGELKLLTADETTAGQQQQPSGSGATSHERTAKLEANLAVAREDLDRANRANTELNSRVADLESQIEDLNALIEAKDEQLATLQNQLKKMMAREQAAPEPTQPATSARPSMADSLLGNPFVLGGLGLLAVGGIAGGMIFMRKRRESGALEEEDFSDLSVEEAETSASAGEAAGLTEVPEIETEEIDEELAPQTSDAISEAEIYIAYGRFPQAITFLQNAIDAEPERSDLQLKLMEVYVQTEDATAFNLQFEKLKALGDEDAIAKAVELQKKIPGAAETAEAAMDATVDSSEPVAAVEAPEEDSDDDFSFDLDDLDSETEDDDLDLSDDLDLDEDSEDLDLDLDLDEAGGAEDAKAAADTDETLSLDEDLDLGDTESDDTVKLDSPAEGGGDDDGLELDLDDDLELDLDDDLDLDLGSEDTETTESEAGESSVDDTGLDLDVVDAEVALDLGELDDSDDDTELDLGELDDSDDDTELDLGELDDSDEDTELDLGELEDSSDDMETELESATDDSDDTELNLDDLDDLDLGDDDTGFSLDDDDDTELNLDDLDDGSSDDDDDGGLDLSDLEDDADFSFDDDTELDLDDDDELDLSAGLGDDVDIEEDAATKLDLARAYIDMGDKDGARSVLEQVVKEGSDSEITEANELLEKID